MRNRKQLPIILAALVIAVLQAGSPTSAHAELSGSVGLGVGTVPDYEGSEDYETVPLPILRLNWGSGRYAELIGGRAKMDLLRSEKWELGPVLNVRRGRDDDVDNRVVSRMREIDEALELGVFAKWLIGSWFIESTFLTDVSDEHDGSILELATGFEWDWRDDFSFTATLFATFADDDYMATYFGVDRRDSRRSLFLPYEAEEGIKDAGISFAGQYRISDSWSLLGSVKYSQLLEDAEDSPLVDVAGDSDQWLMAFGFTYNFGGGSSKSMSVQPISH